MEHSTVRGQLAAAQHRQAARRDAPQQPRAPRPRRRRGAVLPVAGLPVRRREVPLRDGAAGRHGHPSLARRRARSAPTCASSPSCAGSRVQAESRSSGTGSRSGRRTWTGGPSRRPETTASGRRFYAALWQRRVTVDFVHPSADLSGYRLVVAPSLYLLDDAAAREPAGYVEAAAPAGLLLLRHRRRARHRPLRRRTRARCATCSACRSRSSSRCARARSCADSRRRPSGRLDRGHRPRRRRSSPHYADGPAPAGPPSPGTRSATAPPGTSRPASTGPPWTGSSPMCSVDAGVTVVPARRRGSSGSSA